MTEFRTRPDGTKYPLTPKKGTANGAVVAAMATGLLAALGTGGASSLTTLDSGGASSAVGTALDSSIDSAITKPLQDEIAAADRDAKKGDLNAAWRRLALKEIRNKVEDDIRCGLRSHGAVQSFLLRTACTSLVRTLVLREDEAGNQMLVSVAWVTMPSSADASHLKEIEDRPGSGDISPIAAPLLGLAAVRFTGYHYHAELDDKTLVIAEAEPVRGHSSSAVLDAAADVAAQTPLIQVGGS
jgi:hypothetical protein